MIVTGEKFLEEFAREFGANLNPTFSEILSKAIDGTPALQKEYGQNVLDDKDAWFIYSEEKGGIFLMYIKKGVIPETPDVTLATLVAQIFPLLLH